MAGLQSTGLVLCSWSSLAASIVKLRSPTDDDYDVSVVSTGNGTAETITLRRKTTKAWMNTARGVEGDERIRRRSGTGPREIPDVRKGRRRRAVDDA